MSTERTARIGKRYRRIAAISVGAVLFLILVGGVVRSTGSGMGCPDWPKCFGTWVPPTSAEQIPHSFFDTHPNYTSVPFNVYQTWTEYVNRLVGVTIGLLTILTAVFSLGFWRHDRRIPILSILVVFMTGFEGWLGKVVVDKNLQGGFVTIHMLGAMLILAMQLLALYLARARKPETDTPPAGNLARAGLALSLITLVQILIGTQVREAVDATARVMGEEMRGEWLSGAGTWYAVHRVLWFAVGAGIVLWVRQLLQQASLTPGQRRLAVALIVLLGLEVLFGIVLAGFSLPAWMQPVHLLLATLLFGIEFYLWITVVRIEKLFFPGATPIEIKKTLADAK